MYKHKWVQGNTVSGNAEAPGIMKLQLLLSCTPLNDANQMYSTVPNGTGLLSKKPLIDVHPKFSFKK